MPGYSAKPISGLIGQIDAPTVNRSPAEARIRGFGAGALDALANLMGADDPSSQLMGVVGPMGMAAKTPGVIRQLFGDAVEEGLHPIGTSLGPADLAALRDMKALQAGRTEEATKANIALKGLLARQVPKPVATATGHATAMPIPKRTRAASIGPRYQGVKQDAPGFESKYSGAGRRESQ